MKGRTTIGEMAQLPNRMMHHYYWLNFKRADAAANNPKGPEAQQLEGEALQDQLTGMI